MNKTLANAASSVFYPDSNYEVVINSCDDKVAVTVNSISIDVADFVITKKLYYRLIVTEHEWFVALEGAKYL